MAFYVGTMGMKSLCANFGLPHSTMSRVLNEAEEAIRRALVGHSPDRIVWPTLTRQKALAHLTAARDAILQFIWGSLDVRTDLSFGGNTTVLAVGMTLTRVCNSARNYVPRDEP
ncbi:hypothetical protein GQ600_7105 [Phytophthora cactorum]|nr:hypothetical protein GQ600_7105 [Phytophthora cactorum]